ncbi:hypothetical protein R75461_08371 [Paraburkholderia nemoris]|nr:hypothetical protein R75461_08370 [Paraburkholderia nemoris]CAE6867463.1 hypothetical protein R75461_08371 [Paraburkholderia nemoris]
MASTLVAFTAPAATPVSTREPAVPAKSTTVPSVSFATVMFRVVASCCTRPVVPSLRLVVRFVMSEVFCAILVVFCVTRSSMLVTAAPTLVTVVPPTV